MRNVTAAVMASTLAFSAFSRAADVDHQAITGTRQEGFNAAQWPKPYV